MKTVHHSVFRLWCDLQPIVCLLTRSRHRWRASAAVGLEALLPLLEHVPGIKGPLGNQSLGLLGMLYVDRGFYKCNKHTEGGRSLKGLQGSCCFLAGGEQVQIAPKSANGSQVYGMLYVLICSAILGQG